MPLKSEKHGIQLAAARASCWTKPGARDRAAARQSAYMADPVKRAAAMVRLNSPEANARGAESRRVPAATRFFKYCSPEPNTGCWLWSGSSDSRGYGQLRVDGKLRFATHISLELDGRPRPFPDACARHKCDFPPCVNPDHLEWGTRKENSADAISRGRLNLSGLALGRGQRA